MILQIDRQSFRGSLANCRVMVCEHLDESITIAFGPHQAGIFDARGNPFAKQKRSRGNAAHVENSKQFSTIAWKSPKRLSHIPTASATGPNSRNLRKGEEPKPDI